MSAQVIPLFDTRSERIIVSRSALSAAAENATGASQSAADAIARALDHIWSGHRAGAIHELERIGFELAERLPNLLILTKLAEDAPAWCPDKSAAPSHGRAA